MRQESEFRSRDEKAEKEVAKFLDKYFYTDKNFPNTSFKRVDCFGLQIKGIDIILSDKDNEYTCDEKAAITYCNKDLKTYAFELEFINRSNKRNRGWLIDKKKTNTHYVLVWMNKCKRDNDITMEDIKEIDISFISKKTLYNYFKSKKWNGKKMMKKVDEIRETEGECFMGDLYKHGVRFHYTNFLVEKPINILIPKSTLRKISEKFVTIKV